MCLFRNLKAVLENGKYQQNVQSRLEINVNINGSVIFNAPHLSTVQNKMNNANNAIKRITRFTD